MTDDIKTTEFVHKAKLLHGSKYDYNKTVYVDSKSNVAIKCHKHNSLFYQSPSNHLKGKGCPTCGLERTKEKKTITPDGYIKRVIAVHGSKYDYSKTKYIASTGKVTITCPLHGDFEQRASNHLQGDNCPLCANESRRLETETVVGKFQAVHGNRYDYSKVKYSYSDTKVDIVCKKHGLFSTLISNHLAGKGCPVCGNETIGNKLRGTLEEFISRASAIHSNFYDYSEVKYKLSSDRVKIACPFHGYFYQTPVAHLQGKGCTKCAVERAAFANTYTTEEFIKIARVKHLNKYTYDKSLYRSGRTRVTITCPMHGDFEQNPVDHMSGCGCQKCSAASIGASKAYSQDDFIKKAKEVHGNRYGYENTIYTKSTDKVKVICREHGEFSVNACAHLQGVNCMKCVSQERTERLKTTLSDFIIKANKIHKGKYTYDGSVYVNAKTKLLITCKKHGDFLQAPDPHLKGAGCPRCKESAGEKYIVKLLTIVGVEFIQQYGLPNNRYKYDFYLPDHSVFIEFHGEQHYRFIEFFHKTMNNFLERKYVDKIKAKLVKEYKGKLITLHYKQLDEGVLANSLIDQLKKLNIITSDQAQSALAISSEEEEEQASDNTSSLEHND